MIIGLTRDPPGPYDPPLYPPLQLFPLMAVKSAFESVGHVRPVRHDELPWLAHADVHELPPAA
jgi:hypothetical protein